MTRQRYRRQIACLCSIAVLLVECGVVVPAEPAVAPTPTPMTRLDGQHALFVLPDGYSEVEYGTPRRILEELGAVVTVASWTPDVVTGHRGTEMQPERLLADVHAGDYDAIVFVGGTGVRTGDPDTQRIVQEAVAGGKVLAAICAAQGILTRAGLLKADPAADVYVERQDRIIWASGPIKAREFGETIAVALGE